MPLFILLLVLPFALYLIIWLIDRPRRHYQAAIRNHPTAGALLESAVWWQSGFGLWHSGRLSIVNDHLVLRSAKSTILDAALKDIKMDPSLLNGPSGMCCGLLYSDRTYAFFLSTRKRYLTPRSTIELWRTWFQTLETIHPAIFTTPYEPALKALTRQVKVWPVLIGAYIVLTVFLALSLML
jgi:hypothetical protein